MGDTVKEGQTYTVNESRTSGVIHKIEADKVTLRRLVEHDGTPVSSTKLVEFRRSSLEKSVADGHLTLGGVSNPNLTFKLRKLRCT